MHRQRRHLHNLLWINRYGYIPAHSKIVHRNGSFVQESARARAKERERGEGGRGGLRGRVLLGAEMPEALHVCVHVCGCHSADAPAHPALSRCVVGAENSMQSHFTHPPPPAPYRCAGITVDNRVANLALVDIATPMGVGAFCCMIVSFKLAPWRCVLHQMPCPVQGLIVLFYLQPFSLSSLLPSMPTNTVTNTIYGARSSDSRNSNRNRKVRRRLLRCLGLSGVSEYPPRLPHASPAPPLVPFRSLLIQTVFMMLGWDSMLLCFVF